MSRQSSLGLDIGVSGDGFLIGGGTTSKRAVSLISGDVALSGGSTNTYTFPSGSCTLAPAAFSFTDQTASRVLGTVYQNMNSGDSLLCSVSARCHADATSGVAVIQAYCDKQTTPTQIASGKVGIESGLSGEDVTVSVVFAVPPGYRYAVSSVTSSGTVIFGSWIEVLI